MYKKKLIRISVISLLSFCLLTGCNEKKEDTPANNAIIESSSNASVTDNKNDKQIRDELMTDPACTEIIDTLLSDGYNSSPGTLKWAIVDLGYSEEDAEYYVNNVDLDWYEYIKLKINYEIEHAQRSEYDLRSRLESVGYTKDMIDKAINDLGLDFNEICYSKVYDKFNGRYPDDESSLDSFKEELAELWDFTNSQIEYAVNKLAENCK